MSDWERGPMEIPPAPEPDAAHTDDTGSRQLSAHARGGVFPPWTGWDVVAVVGFAVAAVVLCSTVGLGIAHLVMARQHVSIRELAENPVLAVGCQMAAYPAAIFFMILLVRGRADEAFWRAIRWCWPGRAAPAFVVAGSVVALGVDFLSRYLPIPKSVPMDKVFSEMAGAYLMTVFGVTLAPLLEELFFRGMLYPLMRRTIGVTPAVLFTATMFAAIHATQLGFAWAPLLSIFVVGVVFTVVREKTGSVATSFLMHCGYNLTLFGMLWIASDHFRHLEKVPS